MGLDETLLLDLLATTPVVGGTARDETALFVNGVRYRTPSVNDGIT